MSNTRQKPILTGIELSRKEDGYWLSFTTAKGNGACLRIETLKDRFGYITWKAIMEWAIEQTEQPEISIGAEMADCFDKMIGTTPKFLESITEHSDVQRLVGQVETLSQENKKLVTGIYQAIQAIQDPLNNKAVVDVLWMPEMQACTVVDYLLILTD